MKTKRFYFYLIISVLLTIFGVVVVIFYSNGDFKIDTLWNILGIIIPVLILFLSQMFREGEINSEESILESFLDQEKDVVKALPIHLRLFSQVGEDAEASHSIIGKIYEVFNVTPFPKFVDDDKVLEYYYDTKDNTNNNVEIYGYVQEKYEKMSVYYYSLNHITGQSSISSTSRLELMDCASLLFFVDKDNKIYKVTDIPVVLIFSNRYQSNIYVNHYNVKELYFKKEEFSYCDYILYKGEEESLESDKLKCLFDSYIKDNLPLFNKKRADIVTKIIKKRSQDK